MSEFEIHPLEAGDRAWVGRVLTERWHSPRIVTRGRVHQADELPGFVARDAAGRLGLVTYRVEGCDCEIVSLDSLTEGKGVGSDLVRAVSAAARNAGCTRIWLVTTNDNLRALRFYQKRGFVLAALYRGALDRSRQLKPEIPTVGADGIALRDELELEFRL